MKIRVEKLAQEVPHKILVATDIADLKSLANLEVAEEKYLDTAVENKQDVVFINRYDSSLTLVLIKSDEDEAQFVSLNKFRVKGGSLHSLFNKENITDIAVRISAGKELAKAFFEGLILGHYQFLKYKSEPKAHKLVSCIWENGNENDAEELNILTEAVCYARDLVNEPLSYLTAEKLSEEITASSKRAGFHLTVMDKEAITKEKMGGLLAVNKGAPNPPTFNILEWNPKNAINKEPIVFVGKGVVYDTGGLSLKPTANSMDLMKSDMGGAAAVAGLFEAVAKAKLPIHIVGLIPATENRPGLDAYAPGDIIDMHDGTKVEVLNTDAEGRMILADAISYAKNYNPERIINLATLTGAAAFAIGSYGIVSMGDFEADEEALLTEAGEQSYERLVPFPFWNEYGDLIKSDIADIKNLGGPVGGAITAGKFLQHFTKSPFMHFDIAGPAYLQKGEPYRPMGGTGVGVRILFEYLKRKANA